MCYERSTRQHLREQEESRRIWEAFEWAMPRFDPAPPEVDEPDVTEPERAEEEVTAAKR